ncbi:hypothetical protein DFQ27_000716 [Actinomortierella ambigua]|uniref:Rhodanese domain-containing protein n=1 Tax=Actinomortierella ambigua TaxID=1343610 RepID=A0A9P6QL65_9FUNG|nr:hypothetical protein DFQ27_000716 [Actinomortierella ambigua]
MSLFIRHARTSLSLALHRATLSQAQLSARRISPSTTALFSRFQSTVSTFQPGEPSAFEDEFSAPPKLYRKLPQCDPLTTRRSTALKDGTAQVAHPQHIRASSLQEVNAKLMRDYVQRTPHPPSEYYITLSFYQFRPLSEMDVLRMQYFLLNDLRAMDVVGRIYVSTEGMNAQISCPKNREEEFKTYFAEHWSVFDKIRFNRAMSEGKAFKKLHVRVKRQLVSDGIDNSSFDITDQPIYLTPEEWHSELSSLTKPPILIDMRNHYESSIGHFEHAIRPDVTTFKENVDAMFEICEGKEDQDIYMYCTGGIRCTRSGALLRSKGFKSVKMLQGGVTAYGRYIQERRQEEVERVKGESETEKKAKEVHSIYKGKNFTFDKRLGEPITEDVLAKCHLCGSACDTYHNCSNMACNLLMISCPTCRTKHEGTCGSSSCVDMVKDIRAKQRTIDEKHPELRGMKARPGVQPFHNHRMRVRPDVVLSNVRS